MGESTKHKNLKNNIEKYLVQNKTLFKNKQNNRNISLFLVLQRQLLNASKEVTELFIFAAILI